jgi:hypothetical protein
MTRPIAVLSLVAVATLTLACGSSSSPAAPSSSTTTTTTTTTTPTTPTTPVTKTVPYAGTYASPDATDVGTVEATLVVPTSLGIWSLAFSSPQADSSYPASAKLTRWNGSIESLTGTFDPATKLVTLYRAGGTQVALTIDLSASSLQPTARYTTLSGTVGSVMLLPRTSSAGTTAPSPLLYCGTFRGDAKGTFTLTSFDGNLSGVASDGTAQLRLDGTLGGSTANFTWTPEPNYLGRGIGTLTGTTMNGLWSLKNLLTGVFEENGNWTAGTSCNK